MKERSEKVQVAKVAARNGRCQGLKQDWRSAAFSIAAFSIAAFSIAAFSIAAFSIAAFSIAAFSISVAKESLRLLGPARVKQNPRPNPGTLIGARASRSNPFRD
jgi:hypothetical protein